MNLRYWDRHKVAAMLAAVSFLAFAILANFQDDIDTQALDSAGEQLTTAELNTLLQYYDSYERRLPTFYSSLDMTTTVLWWVALATIIYSAWTALDIPNRYQKSEATNTT